MILLHFSLRPIISIHFPSLSPKKGIKKVGSFLSSQDIHPSIFDVEELNFCVRYGYRCVLFAIATNICYLLLSIFSFYP